MFDGIITDVQILAADAGHDRLSITASDRVCVLRNDCRKGPNWTTIKNRIEQQKGILICYFKSLECCVTLYFDIVSACFVAVLQFIYFI